MKMPEMETLISELFGAQLFEQDDKLQNMIDHTLRQYDDDLVLSLDDFSAAAGGIQDNLPENKDGENK